MKQADIQVTYIGHYGDDLSVANAARVSFHKESELERVPAEGIGYNDFKLKDADAKLIRYLAKHKHFSPFNHAFLSFRVKAPIFVARQLVKHKFMPWNEVSRRYVDEEPEFYIPDIRERVTNVKQGSGNIHPWSDKFKIDIEDSCRTALYEYESLLADNVAPEVARCVLPQTMMTEWIWSGTLGAYADMLRLRLDPHTQYESRIVANKIYERVEPLFPVSIKALLEN